MRNPGSRIAGWTLTAALCLMAFATASAQAETMANWMVNGNNIGAALLPEVQITEVEPLGVGAERHLVLLSTLAGVPIAILCSGMTLEETKLKTTGSSLGKGGFTGCVAFLNGKSAAACSPHSEGKEGEEKGAGLLLTRLLKGLIVLHQVAPGVFQALNRIEPEEGNIIVSFELGEEEECAVGQRVSLTGKLFVEDGNAEFQTEKVEHLFLQGPLTALALNGNAASIDGSVWARLVGVMHAGLKWSGLPA